MPRRTSKGLAERLRVEKGGLAVVSKSPVDFMTADEAGTLLKIPLQALEPNPDQPRKHFDEAALEELTESVRARGVLQPVVVKRRGETFLLVAGERRYRAALQAGLTEIPAILTDGDEQEIALIENLQREDLKPVEEAEALASLLDERGYTQEQLAGIVGKSRVTINETLALVDLPESIKRECRTSDIAPKSQLLHLVREKDPQRQLALWEGIKSGELTVKQARRVRKGEDPDPPRAKKAMKTFAVETPPATVTVRFEKARVSAEEVWRALDTAAKEAKKAVRETTKTKRR
jgi:ParB family chromosome partitioning protein